MGKSSSALSLPANKECGHEVRQGCGQGLRCSDWLVLVKRLSMELVGGASPTRAAWLENKVDL